MTTLPETLRTRLTEKVESILGPTIDLRTLAQEMNTPSGAIRTRAWIGAGLATNDQVIRLRATLEVLHAYEPDLTLFTAEAGSPVYMQRWWLQRELAENGRGENGLYAHLFRSDDPEELHNHPWPSASLLLHGGPIFEDTASETTVINDRQIVLRPAGHRHRIRIRERLHGERIPAMTLFATGRRVQEWGFEQPDGSIQPIASRTGQTPRRSGAET